MKPRFRVSVAILASMTLASGVAMAQLPSSRPQNAWAVPAFFAALEKPGVEWTYKCERTVEGSTEDGEPVSKTKSGTFTCKIDEVRQFKQAIAGRVTCTTNPCSDEFDLGGAYIVTSKGLFRTDKMPADENALSAAVKSADVVVPAKPVKKSHRTDECSEESVEPTKVTIPGHDRAAEWCTSLSFSCGDGGMYSRCYSSEIGLTGGLSSGGSAMETITSKVTVVAARGLAPTTVTVPAVTASSNGPQPAPSPGRPWAVICGSVKQEDATSRQRAEGIASGLRAAGINANVYDGSRFSAFRCCYWSVIAGFFASKAEAMGMVNTIKAKGFDVYTKKAF